SAGFVRLIRRLGDELGLTVLLVTHDVATLAALTAKVAVLAEQHILAYGMLDTVRQFDHPFIRKFFHRSP
ncbi:MAG: ABC transporter ATP-binding protein, partial [Rhodocyclaceae bacterium]|nr:ABC transporter ATP-binding protein [Rhodocyclaceae bacterium]